MMIRRQRRQRLRDRRCKTGTMDFTDAIAASIAVQTWCERKEQCPMMTAEINSDATVRRRRSVPKA